MPYVRERPYDTYMAKLTLSVDDQVVERAKGYAAQLGTSVSQLVERYLDAVSRPAAASGRDLPPQLLRIRAALKGVKFDREEYIDYLERKYR